MLACAAVLFLVRVHRGPAVSSDVVARSIGLESDCMGLADRPLDEQLDELQAWVLTKLPSSATAPPWSRILLSEESKVVRTKEGSSRPSLPSDELKTPIEFEPRWQEMVDLGLTCWIDLSAQGVWQDALIVLAGPPTRGDLLSHPANSISVNFSSHIVGSDWRVERHLDFR
jgi:hypothetical protein